MPENSDPDPGMAILIMAEKTGFLSLSCNCRAFKKENNCPHINELSGVTNLFKDTPEKYCFDEAFRAGPWYGLAAALHESCHVDIGTLAVRSEKAVDRGTKVFYVLRGEDPLVAYYPDTRTSQIPGIDEGDLFLQRTGLAPPDGNPFHRGHAIDMLSSMTLTESECVMNERNMKSRRQALEESFWYRLAYHCRNFFTQDVVELDTRFEEDGKCIVSCRDQQITVFEIFVPRDSVMPVLKALSGNHPAEKLARLLPESMESITKVTVDKKNNLLVSLYLLLYLPDGTIETIERSRLKNFWYRDSVYVPWLNIIATWRKPDLLWKKFGGRFQKKIRRDRIPEVIENIEEFFSPPNIIDERVAQLAIYRDFHRVIVTPSVEERDWCWLSVDYGFGKNAELSLADIYQAKLSGKRYLPVTGGWVDTRAIDLEMLLGEPGNSISRQLADSATQIKLSRADLFRLQAAVGKFLEIRDDSQTENGGIRKFLNMVPASPIDGLKGLSSHLREYQRKGLEWLAFLFENGFGGLLCDEMGLGKTHQAMGLMVWLLEEKNETAPFLVVCPTTVISHWERKITEYAPALRPKVYYGTDRELTNRNKPGTVIITSYGILMRDIRRLSKLNFRLAAFDEAQFIKNTATKTYAAALDLKAAMKVAITGTPIENSLGDLKALMDLAVPGYLGTDSFFEGRYESAGVTRLKELRQLVSPFTLRRTKKVVLAELPEKIEDIRYCRLTECQVRLYREAVAARRTSLLRTLEHEDEAIPYIHIFALLTLLKQICNHPASVAKKGFDTGKGPLDSGKWEVFEELVDACLENGQKIVIFSQFVKMIEIINRHLKNKGIGFAGITGQTRNRGREIDRFNKDEDCRVFVGSLKAGGSGIDLIGGSVVIHYDRWWNAAKEDQATDRVHRIGQTRGVQVFKLVTEGTLEEKISAIIDRKRKLMADVIQDDAPGTLKTFSRQDLIDLLSLPEQS
ncbi:MAG: DEAD/DEAH box helicase [Dissulfuribacterales bacterium]